MLDIPAIYIALVSFFAAALQAITGFGFALIAMPIFILFVDARTAVTVNIIVSFSTLFLLTIRVRRHILKPVVRNLLMGSLIGLPFGLYAFVHFEGYLLKLIISITTIIFSIILVTGATVRKLSGSRAEKVIGSISGFLASSISLPGPPVILFLNHQGLNKDHFRATTAAYFTLIYPISFSLMAAFNAIETAVIVKALSLVPIAFLGQVFGSLLYPHTSSGLFHRLVPALVMLSAMYTLYTTLPPLV
ncbi:MAG: sulfite exporter TauE/SafE family protein [Peptococcaceae bacterium]|nr:sulfite exporter TauE/SafE family protein [Peptococcaceae bacterium]